MKSLNEFFGGPRTSFAHQQQDFVALRPRAVLVLSPLPDEKLDKKWVLDVLAVGLGDHLNHRSAAESAALLLEFVQTGLAIAVQGDAETGKANKSSWESSCRDLVARAFPQLKGVRSRLALFGTDDFYPGHSNAHTVIVWVFPQ